MKSVKELASSQLSPMEAAAMAATMNKLIVAPILSDPFISAEMNGMNESNACLEAGIKATRSGVCTGDIATKNNARTAAFNSLKSYLKGVSGVTSNQDNKLAAAYLLELLYRPGKRVANLGYTKKTGAFNSIHSNLKLAQALAYITQLGITAMVTDFANVHEVFPQTAYRPTCSQAFAGCLWCTGALSKAGIKILHMYHDLLCPH